jgi:hypothetical protein
MAKRKRGPIFTDDYIIEELPKLREKKRELLISRRRDERMNGGSGIMTEEEVTITKRIKSLEALYYRRKLQTRVHTGPK